MGFGVVFTKVMIVVLQLAVAIVVAGSFATLATGDFDLDYGEPTFDVPTDFDNIDQLMENGVNISISMPLNLTIGGYWPVTDFQYSFTLEAGSWNHTGGMEPTDIEPGEVADLSLSEEINYSPGEEDIYDLIFLGTNFTFTMEITMGYLENMFSFGTGVSAGLTVGPFLEMDVLDTENVTYANDTLSIPIKTDTIAEQIDDALQQIADEFGADLGDFNASDFDIDEIIGQLPNGTEIPAFGASFTDAEGNELWNGSASLTVVNGSLVLNVQGLTQEQLDNLTSEDGVMLNVNVDLGLIDSFDEDLPEEMQDAIEILDGMLLIKSPADDMLNTAGGA